MFVSPEEAVQEVVNHNHRMITSPSKKEAEAVRRLHSAVEKAAAGNPGGRAEKMVKLVEDLDVVFYGGRLLGHIDVSWGGQMAFWAIGGNAKHAWGVTMKRGSRQCKILLSRELILTIPDHFNSFVQAWSTILHEMAHALTIVRCRRPPSDDHGSHFRTTLHAVHRHSMQRFRLPAISDWESKYTRHHFLSDYWALRDRSGYGEVVITSLQNHRIPNYHATTGEPRAASHRRHGKYDDTNGNGHKKHSKSHDNGHRKYDDFTAHVKAKYPQGAIVQKRGASTCTLM